ncbi:SWIM zinc finger family protein [Streptomyces sp. NPDC090114]|uniref:SWIM zinc finger family protein n=1 Tax=Streptomyces sp. NPDC090114 TaxID=3365950 RepID=UPI0038111F29
MTPRPSDEAREALRAARARTTGEPAATDEHAPPTDRPSAPGHPGPGDVAREALRQAVRDRRGAGTCADAADPDREDTDVPASLAPDDAVVADEGPPERPAPKTATARRPGDIAREALRSAREEALRERPAPGDRAPDAEPPERRAPSPRVPRTTRGDRTADARAREVREALTDAFRLPEPAPDTADHRHSHDGRAATPGPDTAPATPGHARRAATPGPESAPGTADEVRPHDVPSTPARHVAAAPRPSRTPHESTPPASATPRSMAAPARDGDLRRTFPALPPRPSDGRGFAETWWGGAWVTALEEGALDTARLARGRGYAEQGHVDAITVTPGLVLAYVQGSRPRPYRVQLRLRTFADTDWERFLDAAADRPGHIAALLDKEMPQSLADCGVPLLPGPGDLDPRCSCPDSGHPCKHAAALCYQTARLLDADPFVLLLLRGRGERQVVDALSRLSATRAARAAQEREPEPLPGIRATEALTRPGRIPLPPPLPPPPHPEQPPVYPAAPGGPDPFALDQLATDAAARAHALLTTGRDPTGGISLWQDAVRVAAARPGSGLTAATRALYSSLARAAGRTPAELARAVAAWRQGGPTGLAVLEEPWDPPAGRFDRARPLLLAADLPAFRPWRNHLTHPRGHVQLRLGRDHLWYAYESEPGHDDWWPRGTPDPDPVGALTGLDAPGDL